MTPITVMMIEPTMALRSPPFSPGGGVSCGKELQAEARNRPLLEQREKDQASQVRPNAAAAMDRPRTTMSLRRRRIAYPRYISRGVNGSHGYFPALVSSRSRIRRGAESTKKVTTNNEQAKQRSAPTGVIAHRFPGIRLAMAAEIVVPGANRSTRRSGASCR